MERFFRGVLRHRKLVITLFVILTCLSVACIPQVKIDANMSDYLPTSAKSSQDLNDMKEIYGNDITNNARVYDGHLSGRLTPPRLTSSSRVSRASPRLLAR